MILVLNAGSSSIKYKLFSMEDESILASGAIERIGESQRLAHHSSTDSNGKLQSSSTSFENISHLQALESIFRALEEVGVDPSSNQLVAIGHRVVHGGTRFHQAALVDHDVITSIKKSSQLAPLHNPANLLGIEYIFERWGSLPQVAVFDTAFHHSLPPKAYTYAIPYALCSDLNIRRYGFHGSSHSFVAKAASAYMQTPLNELNLITIHLGNGSSMTAIKKGRSIDTSMGLTPLEGLVMGTRSGDIDPSIIFHLADAGSIDIDEIKKILNYESGLKGICGLSDMRELHRAANTGDEKAQLALDVYCYRIKKYIGSYIAILGRVDGIIFTGGVGENDHQIRQQICTNLEHIGISLDADRNAVTVHTTHSIHADNSQIQLLAIRTNEELEIARQTQAVIKKHQ